MLSAWQRGGAQRLLAKPTHIHTIYVYIHIHNAHKHKNASFTHTHSSSTLTTSGDGLSERGRCECVCLCLCISSLYIYAYECACICMRAYVFSGSLPFLLWCCRLCCYCYSTLQNYADCSRNVHNHYIYVCIHIIEILQAKRKFLEFICFLNAAYTFCAHCITEFVCFVWLCILMHTNTCSNCSFCKHHFTALSMHFNIFFVFCFIRIDSSFSTPTNNNSEKKTIQRVTATVTQKCCYVTRCLFAAHSCTHIHPYFYVRIKWCVQYIKKIVNKIKNFEAFCFTRMKCNSYACFFWMIRFTQKKKHKLSAIFVLRIYFTMSACFLFSFSLYVD